MPGRIWYNPQMLKQRSIRNKIKAYGVGLHNGKHATLTLVPAPPNTGIVFRRVDMDPIVEIPAWCKHVGDTQMSTTLVKGEVRIGTVEHLVAAFGGFGIDNAYIDVDNDEIPIMDGSASPFVFLLQAAGVVEQDVNKKFIRIKKKVSVHQENKWAALEPYESGFKIRFTIDFDHPMFNEENSTTEIDFSKTSFVQEVSRARTFGFLKEIEWLRKNKLALGGNLNNAVVIGKDGVINEDNLRFDDECVRHKILDSIGDLYLLGHNLIGAFSAFRSGHELNNILLTKLLADEEAWELVEAHEDTPPMNFSPVISTID